MFLNPIADQDLGYATAGPPEICPVQVIEHMLSLRKKLRDSVLAGEGDPALNPETCRVAIVNVLCDPLTDPAELRRCIWGREPNLELLRGGITC